MLSNCDLGTKVMADGQPRYFVTTCDNIYVMAVAPRSYLSVTLNSLIGGCSPQGNGY